MRCRARQVVVAGVLSMALGACLAVAQAPAPGADASGGAAQTEGRHGQWAGMGRVMGEVTAVNGSTLTVKTGNGSTMEVVTTENTHIRKGSGPVKVTDLHPGDGLVAIGNLDAPNKTLHAAVVMAEDAAEIKAMRDNLGKTYIAGRVTAVDLDDARMTVERTDHVAQTIGFDESTSFRRSVRGGSGGGGEGGKGNGGEGGGSGRRSGEEFGGMGMGGAAMVNGGIDRAFGNAESITLADIKVGDSVAGTGSVKAGTFVPTKLLDTPRGQRRQRPAGEVPPSPAQPGAATAGTPPGPGER